MQFVGIDIASEHHVVAIVNEQGEVIVKPTAFSEDASGYQALRVLLGALGCPVLVARWELIRVMRTRNHELFFASTENAQILTER